MLDKVKAYLESTGANSEDLGYLEADRMRFLEEQKPFPERLVLIGLYGKYRGVAQYFTVQVPSPVGPIEVSGQVSVTGAHKYLHPSRGLVHSVRSVVCECRATIKACSIDIIGKLGKKLSLNGEALKYFTSLNPEFRNDLWTCIGESLGIDDEHVEEIEKAFWDSLESMIEFPENAPKIKNLGLKNSWVVCPDEYKKHIGASHHTMTKYEKICKGIHRATCEECGISWTVDSSD